MLVRDVVPSPAPADGAHPADLNVAVAIIDELTFVGKLRVLNAFLHAALAHGDDAASLVLGIDSPPTQLPGPPELTFVVGTDTLERILPARYYASEADMRAALHQFLSSSGDGA